MRYDHALVTAVAIIVACFGAIGVANVLRTPRAPRNAAATRRLRRFRDTITARAQRARRL